MNQTSNGETPAQAGAAAQPPAVESLAPAGAATSSATARGVGALGEAIQARPRLVRPWLVVVLVLAGALALVGLTVFLPLAFTEEAPPRAVAPRAASQPEVQAALDQAAAALRGGDRAAYRAAFVASGTAARKARDQLFARLSPLPWSRFAFVLQPIPGEPGRFDVWATGELAGVGPADRIAGDRLLDFELVGRRVVATDDVTPPAARGMYLMAFHDAVAVSRPGGVVVADRSWRPLAVKLADDFAVARRRIAATGIRPGQAVAVYLYSSVRQLRAALGGEPAETRIRFFSSSVQRIAPVEWQARDVGVLAPELAGQDAWRPMMLAHELTHAYTMVWFRRSVHQPTLLVEGLATMVEGGRTYAPLRADLAAGSPQLPLLTAIAMGSLWSGSPTERVHLAYLEGASLVSYVLQRWELPALRSWLLAASDSDLSEQGLDAATRQTLHVSWRQLDAGWRRYVYTLP